MHVQRCGQQCHVSPNTPIEFETSLRAEAIRKGNILLQGIIHLKMKLQSLSTHPTTDGRSGAVFQSFTKKGIAVIS